MTAHPPQTDTDPPARRTPRVRPDGVVEVDARGRRCPLPVIDLAQAARDLPSGTELVVLADDPAAPGDIAAWCTLRGHHLLTTTPAPRLRLA